MSVKETIKRFIPPAWRFRVLELKKRLLFESYKANSYSGDGEDIILSKLFPKQTTGLYIDVGCFHPKLISNTYLLYQRGWHGINIDPNLEVIKLFQRARPQDKNILCGVARESGTKTYYNFTHPGVNTFDQAHADEKAAKEWNELVNTRELTCRTLADLLTEHVHEETIDILDVDVEGMDLEVLQSNDWRRFRPRVVLVEDRKFRTKLTSSDIYQYLEEQGYAFHAYNNITLIMTDTQ